jgi:hypothetical protein
MAGDALKGYGLESRATGLLRQPTTSLGKFVKALNPMSARNLIEELGLSAAERVAPDLRTNIVPGPVPISKSTMYIANPIAGLVADIMVPGNTAAGTLAEEDPETYEKIRAMEAAKAGIERAKERAFGVGPTED